jgi:hypothetical protein
MKGKGFGKGKISIRIYRAKTGKWEKPGIIWRIKNLLRRFKK